ncbi:MAG: GTPase HflX [Clostridia bacterium]|nr:GTPase HflX [Clostridia bacterium]
MEEKMPQRALLVALARKSAEVAACERSLDELERLLETAGAEAVGRVLQVKSDPDPATLIGSGKLAEIADFCRSNGVSLVVFDTELSPSQIRNLEDGMEDVLVIDRSMLILDIFALHAKTGEGKLQVELAQLKYTAPRLTGHGKELSRQGGTVGTRGPGESKLEEDRRHIHRRITALERSLAEMEKNRATLRAARDKTGMAKVAIVGYTNAGKSTLLNLLTDAGVLSEDKLFATLDPTTRKLLLPSGEAILLTDTVGLIRKLPHHLVEAFRSTLDEARYADALVIVADMSDEECREHLEVTFDTLRQLDAEGKPTLIVYNKCDAVEDFSLLPMEKNAVCISARTGKGVDAFLEQLSALLKEGKRDVVLRIPYAKAGELDGVYRHATVKEVSYEEDAIRVLATVDAKARGLYRAYMEEEA